MATTYGTTPPAAEAADPTFLAFQRAQQRAEANLQSDAANVKQPRLLADVQTNTANAYRDQGNQLVDNLAKYRALGFGQSGIEAQGEDRIRTQIAQQVQALLTQYQRGSQDVTNNVNTTMGNDAVDLQTQRSAALARMVQDQATAGVGL